MCNGKNFFLFLENLQKEEIENKNPMKNKDISSRQLPNWDICTETSGPVSRQNEMDLNVFVRTLPLILLKEIGDKFC